MYFYRIQYRDIAAMVMPIIAWIMLQWRFSGGLTTMKFSLSTKKWLSKRGTLFDCNTLSWHVILPTDKWRANTRILCRHRNLAWNTVFPRVYRQTVARSSVDLNKMWHLSDISPTLKIVVPIMPKRNEENGLPGESQRPVLIQVSLTMGGTDQQMSGTRYKHQ